MEVKDLQARQGNVELVLDVVEKGDIREFEKFGKPGRVCNAVAKDGSGQVKISLWNEQIDEVKVGDKVKISNGYVNEWQGELQLTTGKFGKFEIVGKAEASSSTEGSTEEGKVYSNVPPEATQPEPKQQDEKPVNDEEYIG
ncbi:MAG: SOSS complex subunit B family protein [Candidatus Woesearchaeota archaeon]|jgi:replication factor A1|nr:SOSS complex subunit B family protein [Candidatus Woesearchaeota archaeon]